MAGLRPADRYLLGDAGLELDIRSYTEALAGACNAYHVLDSGIRLLDWSDWDWGPGLPKQFSRRTDLERYQRLWRERLRPEAAPRIAIEHGSRPRLVDILSVARVLSQAEFGAHSVFVRSSGWRDDLRWRWPIRIAASTDEFDSLHLEELRTRWPAASLSDVRVLSRDHTRNEILVIRGSVRDALQRVLSSPFRMRAAYVMLVGPTDLQWRETTSPLETLLNELQAGGVSFISPESPHGFAGSMNELMRDLSHNTPLDVALHSVFAPSDALHVLALELIDACALPTAMRVLSTRLKALPVVASLNVGGETRGRIELKWEVGEPVSELASELENRAETFPYSKESQGGTAAAELSEDERSARRDATVDEEVRTLQANLFVIKEGKQQPHLRPLRLADQYRLDVFIAPGTEATLRADEPFPEKDLEWGASDRFTLTVLFAEARQWAEVQRAEIVLPRYGPSNPCSFVFTPSKTGQFRARVTVIYQGRVLQTSLLETQVGPSGAEAVGGPAPRLVVETRLRESMTTLDDRQRFDAAVLFNQAVDGKATMQAAGDEGAYIASLETSDQAMQTISSRLHEAAQEARRYSKGLKTPAAAELLVDLATAGNILYRNLVLDYIDRSAAAQALRNSDFLQVVAAKPDAIVPLELVYEYPPPGKGVSVCPNAAKAVAAGACYANCQPTASPAPHVCPMGFWGLRKVIERHVHEPTLQTAARIGGIEPIVGRDELHLSGSVVLGTSKKVEANDQRKLTTALRRRWTSGRTTVVKKWARWPDIIKKQKPVLILALPHSTGAGTEIGLEISGDVLPSRYIVESYVRAEPDRKPPLVILLGCDTANAGDIKAYMSHVSYFRQATAPVILGTLAAVDVKDSAACATKLIEHLVAVTNKKPGRFGTVLREAKRAAVASGLVMALGLAGFGDADWQLTA